MTRYHRREMLGLLTAAGVSVVAAPLSNSAYAQETAATTQKNELKLASFQADVTPPVGHSLLGGPFGPAKEVVDPLYVHGLILAGSGKPIVIASVDWCEIRNDAYRRWKEALAEAAGTSPERVFLAAVHQHDAPLADLTAQKIAAEAKLPGVIIDPEFHERAVANAAAEVKKALSRLRRVTHVGTGQSAVEKIAGNRRVVFPDGRVTFGRLSSTRDPQLRELAEGTIDPLLRTVSFWDGDQALAAISSYATHPMSYYGKGGISADFVGMARRRRQMDDPVVKQIYFSGCSGDVTAGKFNDGSPDNRPVLADKLYQAMTRAWKETKKVPLTSWESNSIPLTLAHRESAGFKVEDLNKTLADESKPFYQRALAAMSLSTRKHAPEGHRVDLQVIELGPARMVLFPGEAFVAYQLKAAELRPDLFVMSVGYGESTPGYIPTEAAFAEHFDREHSDWTWVAPGAEGRIVAALKVGLKVPGK